MLTGRRLFDGETVSDTLAAVLKTDPDWSRAAGRHARGGPQAAAALPRARREAAAARHRRGADRPRRHVRLAGTRPAAGRAPRPPGGPRPRGRRSRSLRPRPPPRGSGVDASSPARRLAGDAAHDSVARRPGARGDGGPAISRDGRASPTWRGMPDGVSRLYVRALDRFESSVIPGSEGAAQPFFSPDGDRIGFFARGKLLTASLGRRADGRRRRVATRRSARPGARTTRSSSCRPWCRGSSASPLRGASPRS